jgi:hypothetical protein
MASKKKAPKRTNPVAVAMKARYGKTTSVHKDKREPRGGDKNEERKLLEGLEEEDNEEGYE